jgi:hypothetical protein
MTTIFFVIFCYISPIFTSLVDLRSLLWFVQVGREARRLGSIELYDREELERKRDRIDIRRMTEFDDSTREDNEQNEIFRFRFRL